MYTVPDDDQTNGTTVRLQSQSARPDGPQKIRYNTHN
jgi:hypothetical protein